MRPGTRTTPLQQGGAKEGQEQIVQRNPCDIDHLDSKKPQLRDSH